VAFRRYSELPGLDGYFFEDSWVLDIAVTDRTAVVLVEAVLTPEHPNFGPPRPGEQHRYERIELRFTDADAVRFEASFAPPAVGATGETDLGNIDMFGVGEEGAFLLEGAWGVLELDGASLKVKRLA
jgi:hypothetical protein